MLWPKCIPQPFAVMYAATPRPSLSFEPRPCLMAPLSLVSHALPLTETCARSDFLLSGSKTKNVVNALKIVADLKFLFCHDAILHLSYPVRCVVWSAPDRRLFQNALPWELSTGRLFLDMFVAFRRRLFAMGTSTGTGVCRKQTPSTKHMEIDAHKPFTPSSMVEAVENENGWEKRNFLAS